MIDAYDVRAGLLGVRAAALYRRPRLRRHYVPRGRRTVMSARHPHHQSSGACRGPSALRSIRAWRPASSPAAPMWRCMRTMCARACFGAHHRRAGRGAPCSSERPAHQGRRQARRADHRRSAPPRRLRRRRTSPPPKPLGKGEHGQLGSHPPRAAQGIVDAAAAADLPARQQTGPAVIQQPNLAPAVTPTTPPKVQTQEKHEERRIVTPPAGAGAPPAGGPAPQPKIIQPVTPQTPPPVVHTPPPPVVRTPPPVVHTPPPVVNKPPPPVVHTPPPVVHTPPPPVVHQPPPPAARTPPPVVRTPPPAAVHTPPPAVQSAAAAKGPPPKKPPPKAGENPPETPK